MPKNKKLDFTKTATELKDRFNTLSNFVYLNGILKDSNDFKKVKLLCESDYNIVSPDNDYVTNYSSLENYIKKLPDKLKQLKALKQEVKQLFQEVQNRAPHLLKTGNFTSFIKIIISPQEVKKVIDNAEHIINYCALNPLKHQSSVGANVDVKSIDMNEKLREISPGQFAAKSYNE